jgi:cytidine deaminase
METKLTNEVRKQLISLAQEARQRAYSPYSNYQVGAALLTTSGRFFTGCNVENAAYPTSLCAERVVVFKAVSEGERQFVAIAVVTSNAATPCGACRQVLAEFGLETLVLVADAAGNLKQEARLAELLPRAFGPGDLGK